MRVTYKQMNAVDTLPVYLARILNCSAIYVSFFTVVFFIRAFQRKACNNLLLPDACDIQRPSHLPLFHHPSKTKRLIYVKSKYSHS